MEETANDRLQHIVQRYQAGALGSEAYRRLRAELLDGLDAGADMLAADVTLPHATPSLSLSPRRRRHRSVILLFIFVVVIGAAVVMWSLA